MTNEQVYEKLMRGEKAWQMPVLLEYDEFPKEKMLENEYAFLNLYASGNPIDPYLQTIQSHRQNAAEIGALTSESGNDAAAVGLLHSVQIQHRKSDGAAFARFVLEDETGPIHCVVFVAAFARLRNNINEKTVVRVGGRINTDDNGEKTFMVSTVTKV